ncbi:MAG: DUF4442 domain-containing protein [Flavobacteriaceae bacterium]
MKLTPRKINAFNIFKLPVVFLTGVHVKTISNEACTVTVKHKWINQNPFKSMFWAVQGMAAELTTGALVIDKIQQSGKNISMLLLNNNASFTKKATGRITFTCQQGLDIDNTIAKAIETGEGQTIWLNSRGVNSEGIQVSEFNFEWTLKVKS